MRGKVATYTELLVLISDTGTLVDDIHVVGEESVTRVLGDDAQTDDDGKSPQVSSCLDKVEIAGGLSYHLIVLNGLLDLSILELNSRVVLVATCMVLGKGRKSLFGLIFIDEESRRLGDEPDAAKLDDGRDSLEEGDGSPRPVVVDVGSSPTDTSDNYRQLVRFQS